ncbi:MAG: flippase-like domain-containing protein [Pseudomonadales bacterium]|nr:flippase-like domain-containing protein [Pseudomonadales bacterium]
MTSRYLIMRAVAIILLIALIFVVQWSVGWKQLIVPWFTISPGVLVPAFLLVFLSQVVRALRVQLLFKQDLGWALGGLFKVSAWHTAVNNLFPFRSGELSFPLLMQQRYGFPLLQSGVGLLYLRLLDLHCLCCVALVAFTVVQKSLVLILMFLVVLLCLPLLVRGRPLLAEIARRARPDSFVAKFFRQLLAMPLSFSVLAQIYGLTVLVWGIKLVAFLLVMQVFIQVEWGAMVLAIIAGDLSSVLPVHGVAGAGSYEAAMLLILKPLGVNFESALQSAVNIHLFLLGSSILIAILARCLPNSEKPL